MKLYWINWKVNFQKGIVQGNIYVKPLIILSQMVRIHSMKNDRWGGEKKANFWDFVLEEVGAIKTLLSDKQSRGVFEMWWS